MAETTFKVLAFFTDLNVFFGARLMIFWDIIVGHFVIQAGFGDSLTFIELHGYRVCLYQIRMSPFSPFLKRSRSGWFWSLVLSRASGGEEELQESL